MKHCLKVREIIHYQDFFAALDRADEIPADVLKTIRAKPDSRTSGQDAKWRKLCRAFLIGTTARGKGGDRAEYYRAWALRKRIAALEAELKRSKAPVHVDPRQVLPDLQEFRRWVLSVCEFSNDSERKILQKVFSAGTGRFGNVAQTIARGVK